MHHSPQLRLFLGAAVATLLAAAGCGRSSDPAAELADLERTFSMDETAVQEPSPETPDLAASNESPDSPQVYVDRAIAAVRAEEPAEGVMLLHSAQGLTTLNAQERMAVQKTIRAVTKDLVRRAAQGDAKAQAELRRIEQYLSVR